MPTKPLKPLRAYAVRIHGSEHETIINTRSAGLAKAEFLMKLDLDGIGFTDLRVRIDGPVRSPDGFQRNADYRGVPFVKAGMRVQVGDDWGTIVAHNSSANWNVLFDADSQYGETVLNCHPTHEIAYFDDDGKVIEDFRSQNLDNENRE